MVCRYLEEELAKKYRDAAPATLALLQDRCSQLSAELALAESKLHAMQDVTSLRTAGAQIQHTCSAWNFQIVYSCEQAGCLLRRERHYPYIQALI